MAQHRTQPDKSADTIEPGIMMVFRWYVAIAWGLQAVVLLSYLHRRALRGNLPTLLNWIELSLLLAYLLWDGLRPLLGRAYLPIALTVATVGPVLWLGLGAYARAHLFATAPATVTPYDTTSLYAWLLVPLVLIAAQYGLRLFLVASVGTSLLSVVLILPLANVRGIDVLAEAGSALGRVLVFTAIGIVVALLSAEQRRTREELARKQEQLARYALTLEHLAVSRERNRIAREMHDTLAHTLSAVSVQLQAIDALWSSQPEAARETLQRTQALTRAGLDEARRALHGLRSNPLETHGLVEAIRETAQDAASQGGAELVFTAPPSMQRERPEVEQQIYRIAEEALNNAAQHASASHIEVALAQTPTHFTLWVRDDGTGFDPARRPGAGHYGMLGMRERAQMLGATYDVRSGPGMGTTVRLDVPLSVPATRQSWVARMTPHLGVAVPRAPVSAGTRL